MAAVAMGASSPATSPRLPSPPPFPEVQLPPKSPGMAVSSNPDTAESLPMASQPLRRIRPGTKAADMASGTPMIPLSELDSPFALQEHLKDLHTLHTRSSSSSSHTTQPINLSTARLLANPPAPSIDRHLWLYELTRFLVLRANDLLVSFFRESPPCSASTCPEMRASEWQYLCAVHEPPKPCCAIDYSCHTLDWAAYILTSQKHFPSRLTLGEGNAGVRQLTNIMRRVYRIFAHAWFQHRGVFWEVEGREGLYCLFKTVCDVYDLIPVENYTIPREAMGEDDGGGVEAEEEEEMRREGSRSPEKKSRSGGGEDEQVGVGGPGATQRRHKATPSVGSAVGTIHEGDEDDKGDGSPVKGEQRAGPVDAMARSGGMGEPSREPAPTSPGKKDGLPPLIKIDDSPVESIDTKRLGQSNPIDAGTGNADDPKLPRSKSSESVATMVRIEEKGTGE